MTTIARICSLLVAYEYLRGTGMSRAEAVSRSVMAASQYGAADVAECGLRIITAAERRSDLAIAAELSPMLWCGMAGRRMVPDPDVVH